MVIVIIYMTCNMEVTGTYLLISSSNNPISDVLLLDKWRNTVKGRGWVIYLRSRSVIDKPRIWFQAA